MFTRFAFAGILASISSVSYAAPPIAFVLAGNTNEVWLTQPDGSGKVLLYRGPAKADLLEVDVRPGGGQLALLESLSGLPKLRVVNYNLAGVATGVTVVPQGVGCYARNLDYHPTDGSLLFSESCGSGASKNISRWNGSTVTAVISNSDSDVRQLRWLRDGSGFLWRTGSETIQQQLRRSDLSNPSAFTVIWQMPYSPSIAWFDTARTTDAFLVSYHGPPAEVRRVEFDFAGVRDTGLVATGQMGHYSPDDRAIAYRFQTRNGYELRIKDATATRTIVSGKIRSLDWGN